MSFKQMKALRTTEIKIIGAFFLVSGLLGFFLFLPRIFPLDNLISFLSIFPTFVFGLTFYAGYLLLLREDERGLEIGRSVVAMQLLNFKIGGLGYSFITGAYIFFGFVNLNGGLNFGLETEFSVTLSDDSPFIFRINILALAVFIYLTRTMRKIEGRIESEEKVESSASEPPPENP
jgi:hypothetical protein